MSRGAGNVDRVSALPRADALNDKATELLRTAIERWQSGDWAALCNLHVRATESHPERGTLLLLVAAAQLQLGRTEDARLLLDQAREARVTDELIGRVLVSGAHNSLARAAALSGDRAKAIEHIKQSIDLPLHEGDRSEMSEARLRAQLQQLGFSERRMASWAGDVKDPSQPLKIEQLSTIDLGMAWAGNTINTVIFRHHGIFTWGEYQYTAFYVDERHLRVVRRELATDRIVTHDIEGEYNLRDAHNSISLGIDRDGRLHICYDHHATRLRYRRSLHPESIEAWTDELPMTGANEDRVTYPTFILPRAGYPLTLLYRDGVHNRGTARLKTYDESTNRWFDRPIPILSGAEHKPWTSNAYWNHPAVGSDGSLHLSFVWRTDTLGEQQLVNNINMGYAWSPDNGVHWFTASGQPYRLPITPTTAETIWPSPPGNNLINQTGMALDSADRPHIVFYANDSRGIPQYQHLWFDGMEWLKETFSCRQALFVLKGGGTLQIPISRPDVLIDASDRAFSVCRADFTDQCLAIAALPCEPSGTNPHRASSWTPLWPLSLGYAEPVIDRTRWKRDNVLSLFVQQTQQPDGDLAHIDTQTGASIIDFRLNPVDRTSATFPLSS